MFKEKLEKIEEQISKIKKGCNDSIDGKKIFCGQSINRKINLCSLCTSALQLTVIRSETIKEDLQDIKHLLDSGLLIMDEQQGRTKQLQIQVAITDNKFLHVMKTKGYNHSSLSDTYELIGILDNIKNIQQQKLKGFSIDGNKR